MDLWSLWPSNFEGDSSVVQPPKCTSPGGLSCGPPPPRPLEAGVASPRCISHTCSAEASICGRTVVHRSSLQEGRGPGTHALQHPALPMPPPPILRHGHSRLSG